MVIGLTGKYCAGKNSVASVFEENGFYHIDVDTLGHKALPLVKDEVVAHFGDVVLDGDEINRKKLGSIIFADDEEKKALERIIHPCMVDMVKDEIIQNSGSQILVNAAILHRMNLDKLCSSIVWVDAPLLTRIKRALKRDGITFKEVLKRIKSQSFLNTNIMKKNTDTYIIRNGGDLERMSASVVKLIEKLNEGNL
jgi:dephospho-CoA kinase